MTGFDGRSYQSHFDALSASGMDVHGEAQLVRSFSPATVLDAGCGTGRVAIELSRHGIVTLGVDVDASMINEARRRGPALEWVHSDLAGLDLGRRFDVVVMAGNVPIFCPATDRPALVRSCAGHLTHRGRLISGFQTDRGYSLDQYDSAAAEAGLVLEERYSTWGQTPFDPDGDYAVSIHVRAVRTV